MTAVHEELSFLQSHAGLPSVDSFIGFLQQCKMQKNLALTKLAHEHACSYGIEAHEFLGNYLVPTFVDCGGLPLARQIFDRMTHANEFSFQSLIEAYMECGESSYATFLYHYMQESGTALSKASAILLLNACARLKCVELGKMLHKSIESFGLDGDIHVSSALVNMYAKCGSLEHAFEVFDQMSIRDVVAWTSLIAGYAEYGYGEKVLRYLREMELEGMSPDSITLVCGLKASANLGSLHQGKGIHSDVFKKGFEGDLFIGNSLIDMYSKCGSLLEAQEVFNGLAVRTSVTWNALITGYSDNHLTAEAVLCLQQMQEDGICPDIATYRSILKACSTLSAINKGLEIHTEIFIKGLERNIFVGTALVDIYAKCGFLCDAQAVLNMLPNRNTVSWNALIAGYAEQGFCKEALRCVQQMDLEGVPCDAITYSCCLKAGSITKDIYLVEEMHFKIETEGYMNDPFVGSTLVDTYVKCGSLAKAQKIFDALPVRHVVSWTALMAGYVEHGLGDKALMCFQEMKLEGILPNIVTFLCTLKACGCVSAIQAGRALHVEIIAKGLEGDPLVGNSLVDMYIYCDSLIEAWEVFDKLPSKNVVSWNTLIAGYAESGHSKEAVAFFEQMQWEGVTPDAATFYSTLNACSSFGMIDKGQAIHTQIAQEGFEFDLFVGSTLVDMYTKGGYLLEAKEVFDSLPVKDVVVWTALIAGFSEKGLGEEAWNLFQLMQREGVPPDVVLWNAVIVGLGTQGYIGESMKCYALMQEQGLLPDCVIYASISEACGNAAMLEMGKRLHAVVHKHVIEDIQKGLLICLIEMYCKCGHSCYAKIVYDGSTKSLATWNALLTGYAHLGESENVFSLFERGCKVWHPDELTFLSILNACCHEGLLCDGINYFVKMSEGSSFSVSYEHCNCIVDLVARAGQLNEALAMIEKLPFHPDIVTWTIVLGACQKWGNAELGRQAFACATRLNDMRAAAFVMMSNIYSDNGMCDMEWKDEIKGRSFSKNV